MMQATSKHHHVGVSWRRGFWTRRLARIIARVTGVRKCAGCVKAHRAGDPSVDVVTSPGSASSSFSACTRLKPHLAQVAASGTRLPSGPNADCTSPDADVYPPGQAQPNVPRNTRLFGNRSRRPSARAHRLPADCPPGGRIRQQASAGVVVAAAPATGCRPSRFCLSRSAVISGCQRLSPRPPASRSALQPHHQPERVQPTPGGPTDAVRFIARPRRAEPARRCLGPGGVASSSPRFQPGLLLGKASNAPRAGRSRRFPATFHQTCAGARTNSRPRRR